ncbi:dual specificity protein phosphatase 13-like [Megalops cyprinoides]|uniref:dual specificity protein phosphatase 13-like n=1 Tax=Megalops cyprinoides TaxID=118141 RepID=UPI001864C88E|nr:dual specificity protein phosphatase 13-like [Megalops cyprinoides]
MALKETHSSQREWEYKTPPISDLLHLLLQNRHPTGPVNEVWPNVYIGDAHTARNKAVLCDLGITHIVNAADGPHRIDTGPSFYSDIAVQYYGVDAPDSQDFDLSPFFYPTAEFIQGALSQKGKVFVHCARGISRSATLVFAFLMISVRLTLAEAIKAVRKHRNVLPNAGFLSQLCRLDMTLSLERAKTQSPHKSVCDM